MLNLTSKIFHWVVFSSLEVPYRIVLQKLLKRDIWWDANSGVDCGPDDLDDDDDNDGIDDILDMWPLDPCATRDSDYDGMPDELRCPTGTESTLVEDTDDNNDGVLDVDAFAGADEGGATMSMVAAVLLFIAIAALVINRMRQQE